MAFHQKIAGNNTSLFLLLVDEDRSDATAYGARKENGKSIERTMVVVEKGGNVAFYKRGFPIDAEMQRCRDVKQSLANDVIFKFLMHSSL